MPYAIGTEASEDPQVVGGKAAALARLQRARLPVPAGIVVPPDAFFASLTPEARRRVDGGEAAAAPDLDSLVPAPDVSRAIATAIAGLAAPGGRFAVRSSAVDEDGAGHSFAGQFESYLNVAVEDVPDRVAEVWRSGFSDRVAGYRVAQGLPAARRPPAVLIQPMIDATAAGVAFGVDPVSGRRDVAVVSAVPGLGVGLVSGECDADTWRVDRDRRITERVVAGAPALDDAQVVAVADLVRRCGELSGRPQDIEWAVANRQLWLLQSRPITSLGQVADASGPAIVWDNSNIAESYNGVTTPLTFSFARTAYEGVYREFCRLMGVSPAKVAAHDLVFRRMLGLLAGRVYYNLESWYRVLALLPGFTANRRFMEQMMGVREPLPDAVLADLSGASRGERLRDALRLVRSTVGLAANHFRLPRMIARFHARLDDALGATPPPFAAMRADELAGHYRLLERKLLTRWDAPLVNDFFAMIFHGVLRRVTERWCGARAPALQNDLLRGEPGMISVEPARRLREMAALARRDDAMTASLCDDPRGAIERRLADLPDLEARYRSYLDRFGDRCLEELKLESPTLDDDPLLLLRSIGQLARRPVSAAVDPEQLELQARLAAEAEVRRTLRGRPLRRAILFWVLRHARVRMRDRENLRFERTRLFGRVRRTFLEIGRRFHEMNRLDDARDVFWLEVDEVLGFIDGTTTTTELRGIVAVRRAEFERYRRGPAPDGRFETRGVVHVGNAFRAAAPAVDAAGDERRGLPCCPGQVRGRARVIVDPRSARLQRDEILVASRTDPGWVLLFPAAAGLVVEHGSLLSHSAIVARELGLPAIVSVAGVTAWLADGDLIEMDGGTGVVRRLSAAAGAGEP